MEYPIIGENEGGAYIVTDAAWTYINLGGHVGHYIHVIATDGDAWTCYVKDDTEVPFIGNDTSGIDATRHATARIPNVAMPLPNSMVGFHRMVRKETPYLAVRSMSGNVNVRVVRASDNTITT